MGIWILVAALESPRTARTVALGRTVSTASTTVDTLLEQLEPSVARRLTGRELRVESIIAALFAATAIPMAVAGWGEPQDLTSAVLLVATYAFVARVRFQVGSGLVRPTQLVLVPMLFLLPASTVPLLVALASVLSELPEIARRKAHPERALVAVADSWHAIGPALVVQIALGDDSSRVAWGVYLVALAAQFAVDFAVSTLREWLGAGISPRRLAPVLAMVYLVDTLLAPIGFLAVLASRDHPQAYLLAVAPGALLALIARERRNRIELDLRLGSAYRHSTRALDEQAQELRRQAGRLQRSERRVEAPVLVPLDRGALERLLLTTTMEAIQADCGRLSVRADDGTAVERVILGQYGPASSALRAAEAALLAGATASEISVGDVSALAIPLASGG